jgi:hypothetical protein
MFESTSILGLSWTAILGDLLSVLSAISGPVLLFMVLRLYVKYRDQALPPVLFPAILFALTSVAIQILSSSLTITGGYRYNEIGPEIVRVFFLHVHSLLWRVIEVGACVLIAVAFQFTTRRPAIKTETNNSSGLLITTGTTCLAAALTSGGLLWFYVNVVRSQATLFDQSRPAEAAAVWANMGVQRTLDIESLFRLLSRPFLLLSLSAATLTIVLIVLGVRSLKSGPRRRWDFAVSGLLAMAILGACLPALSGMARDTQYLRSVLSLDRAVPFAPVRSFPTNSEEVMDLLFPRLELPVGDLVNPPPAPPELNASRRP